VPCSASQSLIDRNRHIPNHRSELHRNRLARPHEIKVKAGTKFLRFARLPHAREKQYKLRDTELPGFFVLIGKRKKSFMAQGEFWRDGVREFAAQVKPGEFGDISTREARSKVKEALGSIARGQRPGESPRAIVGSVTRAQAPSYRAKLRRTRANAQPPTLVASTGRSVSHLHRIPPGPMLGVRRQ
jgi:hypothetical protein